MASDSGNLLSTDAAATIVQAQQTRLREIGAEWRLAFTQRPERLEPSYDTLVINLPNQAPARSMDQVPSVLREVLLVLHALSGCQGFSYRDNPTFWMTELRRPNDATYARYDIPKPNRMFLRVVVFCSYHEISQFQRKLFDLFFPARMGAPDQSTLDTLEELLPFGARTSPPPIECAVRLQLAKTANDTRDILAYVTTQLEGLDEARGGSPLQLIGLELEGRRKNTNPFGGLKAIHLKPLQKLAASLPQSVTLALRFRRTLDPSARGRIIDIPVFVAPNGFNSFVKRMCGFQGSEFVGRLEVLDLVGAFGQSSRSQRSQLNFASFCPLLPFTATLREVRVRIVHYSEWLWLAYAAFHPQSHQSAWRSLILHVDFSGNPRNTNWRAVNQFIQAGATLTSLMELINNEPPRDGTEDEAPDRHEARTGIRRTAITIEKTTVYEVDQIRRQTTLARGETVELCGAVDTDSESVVVLVPGFWFGYVSRSSLSAIIEVEPLEPPTSCITSLHVAAGGGYPPYMLPDDELGVLRMFGSTLTHLRIGQPGWFRQPGFSQYVPQLELIDCCHFYTETASADFVGLRNLRALRLSCGDPDVERCFRDLLLPCKGKLKELHLQLIISPSQVPAIELLLRECIGWLLHLKLEIRPTYAYNVYQGQPDVNLDDISTNSDLEKSKLAFLSAVHHAQTQHSGEEEHALARLDSHLIRLVFDHCGLRLESLIVAGPAHHWHEFPTPNETSCSGGAWFSLVCDD